MKPSDSKRKSEIDSNLIDLLNAGYACPPDAGPAWRAAHESGIDMSLIESSLQKTPWERILEHDAALELAEDLRIAGEKRRAST